MVYQSMHSQEEEEILFCHSMLVMLTICKG